MYILPFLCGSNDNPRGGTALIGFSAYHHKVHCLGVIYEGVAFSHKTHIDRLLKSQRSPKRIRLAGGAVNVGVWVQIIADVLGLPIETIYIKELDALGCALAGAIVAGKFRNYAEAIAAMVNIKEPVLPNSEQVSIYRKKYETYSALCAAVSPHFSMC